MANTENITLPELPKAPATEEAAVDTSELDVLNSISIAATAMLSVLSLQSFMNESTSKRTIIALDGINSGIGNLNELITPISAFYTEQGEGSPVSSGLGGGAMDGATTGLDEPTKGKIIKEGAGGIMGLLGAIFGKVFSGGTLVAGASGLAVLFHKQLSDFLANELKYLFEDVDWMDSFNWESISSSLVLGGAVAAVFGWPAAIAAVIWQQLGLNDLLTEDGRQKIMDELKAMTVPQQALEGAKYGLGVGGAVAATWVTAKKFFGIGSSKPTAGVTPVSGVANFADDVANVTDDQLKRANLYRNQGGGINKIGGGAASSAEVFAARSSTVLGRGAGLLGTVVSRAALPLAAGLSAYDGYTGITATNEALAAGEITQREASRERMGTIGEVGGEFAGALGGAAIGTAIFPVIGTAIGGAIGYWLGGKGGEMAADALSDALDSAVRPERAVPDVPTVIYGIEPQDTVPIIPTSEGSTFESTNTLQDQAAQTDKAVASATYNSQNISRNTMIDNSSRTGVTTKFMSGPSQPLGSQRNYLFG